MDINKYRAEDDETPLRYLRPERDDAGVLGKHVKYWGRDDDALGWRMLRGEGLTDAELRVRLKARWELLDAFNLAVVEKTLRRRDKIALVEKIREERRKDEVKEKEDNERDVMLGLGFVDEKTGIYWTWEEWKEYKEIVWTKLETVRVVEDPKGVARTREAFLVMRDAEDVSRAEVAGIVERKISIEKYLNWKQMQKENDEQPSGDATPQERMEFFERQRGAESSKYVVYAEKHFGNITHTADVLNRDREVDASELDVCNVTRVSELLHAEYESRYSSLKTIQAERELTKDMSRAERVVRKAKIESLVSAEQTEGKITGVVWNAAKNRWRVYIAGTHHGYFLTQLAAKNVADEVRKTG